MRLLKKKNREISLNTLMGVFFVAFSTLMFEIVLTRIFSVTLWYHFSFMSVSIAMFGLSVGGIIIYLKPETYILEKLSRHLTLASLFFSISIIISYFFVLGIPVVIRKSFSGFLNLFFLYVALSVPFILSGFAISLAFKHLSKNIHRLYFFDLLGAGIGCLIILIISNFVSAPSIIVIISILALLGSYFFARDLKKSSITIKLNYVIVILISLLIINQFTDFLEPTFVKGKIEKRELTVWNSFSRVVVLPITWEKTNDKYLTIDATAATVLCRVLDDVNHSKESINYLKTDVSNIGHYLKRKHNTLIIGVGGGKDILSAKAFNAKKVTGVDINPIFLDIHNHYVKRGYTKQFFNTQNSQFIVEEGRSYLEKSNEKFDIIQISLIDTWAATTAGAFTLAENNLYTVEAFKVYIDHLTDSGILSITRFIFNPPNQTLRIASLCKAVAKHLIGKNASQNIIIVSKFVREAQGSLATVLLKKSPFSLEEIKRMQALCKQLEFRMIYSPVYKKRNEFAKLLRHHNPEQYYNDFYYDVTAPTDDKPFFFHMIKAKDIFKSGFGLLYKPYQAGQEFNFTAVLVLYSLLFITIILSIFCIVIPLTIKHKEQERKSIKNKWSLLTYFSCLTLGFMVIEITLMQRFILFLGHPTFSLSVILFSILIFGGVGSYISGNLTIWNVKDRLVMALILLILALIIYSQILTPLLLYLISYSTIIKIIISIILLSPIGLLLGMPFPMGISIFLDKAKEMIPWYWSVNGAFSVVSSVLAMVSALIMGFTFTLYIGIGIYLIGLISILIPIRSSHSS
jgi:spermidine synthase